MNTLLSVLIILNTIFIPIVSSPQPTCIGEFSENLTVTYEDGHTIVTGEIEILEESLYVILCRDAYNPDYPSINSSAYVLGREFKLYWLIDRHIIVIGPFKVNTVMEIK